MVAHIDDDRVRVARPTDAERLALLLHDFNLEFEERTPGPAFLEGRLRRLLEAGEVTVLLAGRPALGLAVLRFRPALWSDSLDCEVEELYVAPANRGRGFGRALMEEAIELARARGAGFMYLGTGEDDHSARSLYESLGFSARGGRATGPKNLFYERDL